MQRRADGERADFHHPTDAPLIEMKHRKISRKVRLWRIVRRSENSVTVDIFDLANDRRENECADNEADPVAGKNSQKSVPEESAHGSSQRAARDQKSAEYKKKRDSKKTERQTFGGEKCQRIGTEASQRIAMGKND